jgi:predicted transcriptional regulator
MSIYGLALPKNVRILLVPNQTPPYITNILKSISDDKALALFNSIAILGEKNVCIPSIKEMKLTTKQYYSRIAGLMKADLIKKSKGCYSLTLLGKIVYDAHLNIGRSLNNYWKLKALDSIQASAIGQLPEEEFIRLADTLLDNHQIKNVLFGANVDTIKKGQPVISV